LEGVVQLQIGHNAGKIGFFTTKPRSHEGKKEGKDKRGKFKKGGEENN
jgi:hypothetical protein